MERDSKFAERHHDLREVLLPAGVGGMFWLTELPDTETRLARFLTATQGAMVSQVVVLVQPDEMNALAPSYAAAIGSGKMPFAVVRFPIRDFGVPEDAATFLQYASQIATALRGGARIVLHCRGGIGRTGMMAQAVLSGLGMTSKVAEQRVADAGSHCETAEQSAFLKGVLAHANG